MRRLTTLGRLKPGERTGEIRFVNADGQTEVWIIAITQSALDRFKESVSEAYLDDDVDFRISRQRRIIDRLMRVIRRHGLEEEARREQ